MDVKRFVLSYYKNATSTFYISEITAPTEACNLHTHDYFQVYYMLSGKITHHLESGCAELSGGDVFIVPPNLPHYIDANDGPVDFYAMSFMPDFFLGIGESNKLIADFLYYLKTAALENIQPKFTLPHEDIFFIVRDKDALCAKLAAEDLDAGVAEEFLHLQYVCLAAAVFHSLIVAGEEDVAIFEGLADAFKPAARGIKACVHGGGHAHLVSAAER